jgi:hypothetical protein
LPTNTIPSSAVKRRRCSAITLLTAMLAEEPSSGAALQVPSVVDVMKEPARFRKATQEARCGVVAGELQTPYLRSIKCVGFGAWTFALRGKSHTFESCRARHSRRALLFRRDAMMEQLSSAWSANGTTSSDPALGLALRTSCPTAAQATLRRFDLCPLVAGRAESVSPRARTMRMTVPNSGFPDSPRAL